MKADEMKATLDTSLAQTMGKINVRFDKLDAKVDQKASREDIDRLFNSIDSFAKRLEISDDERIVMSHQLADKIGVTLTA